MEEPGANVNLDSIRVHCPFGCTLEDCDEHGYCHHLVGFTNDGKSVETVQPHKNPFTGQLTGKKFVDGRKASKVPVKAGDVLVNPESKQIDNGAVHTRKEWVSSRVYRKDALPSEADLETMTRPAAG